MDDARVAALVERCLEGADPLVEAERLAAGDAALREAAREVLQRLTADGRMLDGPGCGPGMTEAAPGSDPSIGAAPEQIGRYHIRDVLGEGGMGTVYRAEQTEPVRREVALKLIKRGMDTREVLLRFERERQALAAMSHSAIAKVLDADATADGRPYFVMELVVGASLTRYADAHRLSLRQRIALFQEVCAGVQHAHQKGVIHRDLKPGNILVTEEGERAVPKILDFGLAKATGQDEREATMHTELGRIMGTPEYMAPEQAAGETELIDTRADVYALGVILYELLSGSLPFTSMELRQGGWQALREKLVGTDPSKPSTKVVSAGDESTESAAQRRMTPGALRRALRGDLDWIVLKALSREPDRRYESAAALAQDLQRHLDLEPVLAGPPSAGYRLSKLLRRYRGAVASAAAVLVVLLAGLGTTLWYLFEAEAQRALANTNEQAANRNAAQADARAAEAREARAEAHVRAARLAYERGRWEQLLDECAQAREAGYRVEDELRVLEFYGNWGLQREVKTAVARLAEIEAEAFRGEALLLRGIFGFNRWGDSSGGLALIRQALADGGLSEAHERVAMAYLGGTVSETLSHLRAAAALDPHSRLANAQFAYLGLMFLGPRERGEIVATFRALYPEDVTAGLAVAVDAAMRGDSDEVDRWLEELEPRMPLSPVVLEGVEAAVSVLEADSRPNGGSATARGVLSLVSLFRRLQTRADRDRSSWDPTQTALAFPSSVTRAFTETLLGVTRVGVSALFLSSQQSAARLDRHFQQGGDPPWGYLLAMWGAAKVGLGEYEEAENLLQRALTKRGFVGAPQWLTREALLTAQLHHSRTLSADSIELRAVRDRIRDNILAMIEIPGISAEQFEFLALAAEQYVPGDPVSAVVLARWQRMHPEDPAAVYARIGLRLRSGAPGQALLEIDRALAEHPDDEGLRARRRLAIDLVGKVGPWEDAVPLEQYLSPQEPK